MSNLRTLNNSNKDQVKLLRLLLEDPQGSKYSDYQLGSLINSIDPATAQVLIIVQILKFGYADDIKVNKILGILNEPEEPTNQQ